MSRSIPARWCTLALLGIVTTAVQAQIKTDGQWRGSGGAALSLSSGNTRSSALNLKADGTRATETDRLTLGASADYARSRADGLTSTTANKWNLAGRYDYNLGPRSFVFGKLGLERDELVQLNLRSSMAVGGGFKLIDSRETSFNVFGGIGHSRDSYASTQTIDGMTGTRFSRGSLLLGEEFSHQLTSTTSLKQRLELSPGFSGDKAVLARLTAGVNVAINRTLGLDVGLVSDYNSRPAQGKASTDTRLFTGVNFRFGAP